MTLLTAIQPFSITMSTTMTKMINRFSSIFFQPRYLLTSLASNDLAIGLLVTPFGFLPAVYGCWPYGEVVCQIQVIITIYYSYIL